MANRAPACHALKAPSLFLALGSLTGRTGFAQCYAASLCESFFIVLWLDLPAGVQIAEQHLQHKQRSPVPSLPLHVRHYFAVCVPVVRCLRGRLPMGNWAALVGVRMVKGRA